MLRFAVASLLCLVLTAAPQYHSSESFEIIPYNYAYEIQDPDTSNYQNKAEMKLPNGDVFGSYSVLMPDGFIYTTMYNITDAHGHVRHLSRSRSPLAAQESESSE